MAYICENCHRGIVSGHNVSHAKNRTPRVFKPNLQKLKVSLHGVSLRVRLCTRCIKRLRKDRRLGKYALISPIVTSSVVKAVEKKIESPKPVKVVKKVKNEKPVKTEKPSKPVKTLDISSIVGSQN